MVQALNNLQNSLTYDVDLKDRGNEIAYALYVLARNRKASISDLRYYADTQLEDFSSPLAKAQLAASLALYGDAQRSEAIFARGAAAGARPRPSTTMPAPTTARACATVPPCWRWPPKAGRCRRSCRELIKLVAAERQGDALHQHAGPGLDAAGRPRAAGPTTTTIQLTVNGTPHSGAYSERHRRRRAASTTRSPSPTPAASRCRRW